MGCYCVGESSEIQALHNNESEFQVIPLNQKKRIKEIITFWFSSKEDPNWDRSYSPIPKDFWDRAFNSTAENDAFISKNFGNDLKNLNSGEYANWETDHYGRLAAIIVFDQFSRTIFRNQP